MVMDVRPLIPSGMTAGIALTRTLYQFKTLIPAFHERHKENAVIQFTADSAGTGQTITLYGPKAPNEVGTKNTTVSPTGTFRFNKPTMLKRGIQVFVGPRRDPFFFDLSQFFKILPDRNYQNQPNPPPPSASSFRFAKKSQQITLNGTSFGTAGSNKCVISKPSDLLVPYNVISIVIEMPKKMLAPSGGKQR